MDDDGNPVFSDINKANFFNKSFQNYLTKDDSSTATQFSPPSAYNARF